MHQEHVRAAVHLIGARLPFALRERHRDSGSEFINTVLQRWPRYTGVRFTLGGPYRKSDQVWVEQRD